MPDATESQWDNACPELSDGLRNHSEFNEAPEFIKRSSALLAGIIGTPPGPSMIESHAGYLSSWIEALRNDKWEIFRAAAEAQKVCDYLSERALAAVPENPVSPKEQATEVAMEPALLKDVAKKSSVPRCRDGAHHATTRQGVKSERDAIIAS